MTIAPFVCAGPTRIAFGPNRIDQLGDDVVTLAGGDLGFCGADPQGAVKCTQSAEQPD